MPLVRPAACAVLLAALALAACAPVPDPADSSGSPSSGATRPPAATPVPTGEASAAPTPPAAEGPGPERSAGALPADCASAYSPRMRDRLYAEFGQLNPPDGSYNTHAIGDLYDIVQPLPALSCLWTPPGPRALMTDAIRIRPEQADEVRAVLSAHIPGCQERAEPGEAGEEFVCVGESEQIQGARRTEYHVLRGDLLLLTAALNADFALVQEAVADLAATIEG